MAEKISENYFTIGEFAGFLVFPNKRYFITNAIKSLYLL